MKTLKLLQLPLLLAFICISYKNSNAQAINTPNYRTAIGLRAGYTSGLTIKHFIADGRAIEGIIGAWPNSFSITGLYEKHVASPTLSGFQWYYGLGAHFTHYSSRVYYYNYEERPPRRYYRYRYVSEGAGIGIDGVLGMEYKIPPIPFALSFDLKPYVEFHTGNAIYMSLDPGLGLKFTF